MKTIIRVGGNIISELSEKIPTNIIALNELIKNSYDAEASFVTIEINTLEKLLRIVDDGFGMDKSDIDTLFHISKSSKIHGKKNLNGRITQGSKGLGFLSVFKFGRMVKWKTKKNKGFIFCLDFDQLIASEDISKYEIELIEDNNISKGTEIIITLDDYNIKSICEYFSLEKNYKKIIHSFDDKLFNITLIIDKKTYSSNKLIPLLNNGKDFQLFYISYNNNTQEILFKYNNRIVLTETYKYPFEDVSIDIELLTFQLRSHGKEKIDKLFFNSIDDITPLIYYNSNLFNNYTIFDPNIMRNIKTSQVMNQMIGFIRILSENTLIDFNSDRSQFLQNELTDSIIDFLYNINKKIQEIGSKNKQHLVGFNILKEKYISSEYKIKNAVSKYRDIIKEDFSFKDKVKIKICKERVTYSLFGKTATLLIKNDKEKDNLYNSEYEPFPAKIHLNCNNELNIEIPSDQIDLRKYIDSIYNSNGESVNNNNIIIRVNGKINKNGILSSINKPCQIKIDYNYSDSKTGIVIERLIFNFIKPIANIKIKKISSLFTIPAQEDYLIKYNQYLNKLIEQINILPLNKYMEIISCSLRVLFELSIDTISKSKKYSNIFNGINDFEKKVIKIINYIKSNKNYKTEISNKTKIEYKSLDKLLSVSDYEKVIGKTHLSSHKSTTYICENDIHYIIKYLSIFIIITNEMINNKNIA
ncbi:MAG: ATP-binding protein [Spirochaetaceae bacterium]|nr:ATP-binding protein [Spirochaetaceae bacterium]